jgi:hypothetical protein
MKIKSKEKVFWWVVVLVCALLQLLRIVEPSIADRSSFESIQLFALATIIAITVSASIISGGLHGKSEKDIDVTTSNMFGNKKKVTLVRYSGYYYTQKKFAIIFSLVIWAILGFSYKMGVLGNGLISFFLPISLIGPALYVRDALK